MRVSTARFVSLLGVAVLLVGMGLLPIALVSHGFWRAVGVIVGAGLILLAVVLFAVSWPVLLKQYGGLADAKRPAPVRPAPPTLRTVPLSDGGEALVVDLRSEANRQREVRARQPLDPDDEALARQLMQLAFNLQGLKSGTEPHDEVCQMIRAIGEQICANGGSDRMDLICYRVAQLGAPSRYVRINWSGICGWQY